jgi:peptide/nickel transport system ATP-binding protein
MRKNMADPSTTPVLEIKNLRTWFKTKAGLAKAVDGISLQVTKGRILGIIGESGCGKSVSAFSILRLLPMPPAYIVSGEILLGGRDLLGLTEVQMRSIRGKEISMIFQEPMTSLNPVLSIGYQLREAIMIHQTVRKQKANKIALEMLELVRVSDPEKRLEQYPHELSGGMRQRVMIAMALVCRPKLLIADEPTTALDVTIQAQILNLIVRLKEEIGMSVILITHDLGVVAETADDVMVMYSGRIVEKSTAEELFSNPMHPYTQGLLKSVRFMDAMLVDKNGNNRLPEIPGIVPNLTNLPRGCAFEPRCNRAQPECRQISPILKNTGNSPFHEVACLEVEKDQLMDTKND